VSEQPEIVVGVDGSGPARAAFEWAMTRAELLGLAVRAVHVIEQERLRSSSGTGADRVREPMSPPDAFGSGAFASDVFASGAFASDVFASGALDAAISRHPSVPLRRSVVAGEVVAGLIEASAGAALLVVGTHKTGFLRGTAYGATGILLAAGTTVPLAVIPEVRQRTHTGVVVGLGDLWRTDGVLAFAAQQASRLDLELVLVRAWTPPAWATADEEFSGVIDERLNAEAREYVRAATDLVSVHYPAVRVRGRMIRRAPAAALVDASMGASELIAGGQFGGGTGGIVHDALLNLVRPTIVVPRPGGVAWGCAVQSGIPRGGWSG
jgi:nucleotide-binding universal stress UspA family protein